MNIATTHMCLLGPTANLISPGVIVYCNIVEYLMRCGNEHKGLTQLLLHLNSVEACVSYKLAVRLLLYHCQSTNKGR